MSEKTKQEILNWIARLKSSQSGDLQLRWKDRSIDARYINEKTFSFPKQKRQAIEFIQRSSSAVVFLSYAFVYV